MEKENKQSKISQSCYVHESLDNWGLDEHQKLDVKQLYRVLEVLIEEGFGDYDVYVGYDCNCAYTGVNNNFDIRDKTIYFKQ